MFLLYNLLIKMSIKDENICRLCLKSTENEFQTVDDVTKNILDVLSLKMNLDIIKNPIICKDCSNLINKSYRFKSTCTNTEKRIRSFATVKETKFEIKYIYEDKTAEQATSIKEAGICRFCMIQSETINFIPMDILMGEALFVDKLLVCMPEMDPNVIKNALICQPCKENLDNYFNLVQNCLNVEEKINKYLKDEGVSEIGEVRISDIQAFLFKNSLKRLDAIAIKQEPDTFDVAEYVYPIVNDKLIKAEEPILGIGNRVILNDNSNPPEPDVAIDTLEEKIYKCDQCAYQTEHKNYLPKHMVTHKNLSERKIYKCPMCTYETTYKSNLTRHHNTLSHKDAFEEKIFQCELCSFQTKRNGCFKRHALTHNEVNTYKCPECAYETNRSHNLKTHSLIHRDVSEVEAYKCERCTYVTKHKHSIKLHMVIHKDSSDVETYRCAMCPFETIRKNSLRRHMVVHKEISEANVYKCAVCTYEAKRKHNLKRHMLIHRDVGAVGMYKCTMCS